MGAPYALDATASGRDSIDLTWVNNPDTYLYKQIEIHWRYNTTWHHLTYLDGEDLEHTDSGGVIKNTAITYRVRGEEQDDTWSEWSGGASAGLYRDRETDTLSITDVVIDATQVASSTITDYLSITDTVTNVDTVTTTATDTLTITDVVGSSQSIKTDWGYYFGSSDGKIYEYSGSYQGDAGSIITSRWQSKNSDFSDQFPGMTDSWKTVYAVKLFYQDLEAIDVTVSLSTDGGASWTSSQQTIGSGTGYKADTTYLFYMTGQTFMLKIENASASVNFQWLGVELEFEESGPHWEVA